jgi:hypothetical protein
MTGLLAMRRRSRTTSRLVRHGYGCVGLAVRARVMDDDLESRLPSASPQDAVYVPRRQGVGSAVRRGGAILEAKQPFLPVALHRLGHSCPGDPSRCSGGRLSPPLEENPIHHQPSAERGESRPTMSHESLLSVRSRQPQTVKEALLVSTTFVGTTTSSAQNSSLPRVMNITQDRRLRLNHFSVVAPRGGGCRLRREATLRSLPMPDRSVPSPRPSG